MKARLRDMSSGALRVAYTNTIMRSAADKRELAEFVLNLCTAPQGAKA